MAVDLRAFITEQEAKKLANNPWFPRMSDVEASWINEAPPPREYLMRDVRTGRGAIPARGTSLLVAAGGIGKSHAAVSMALAHATKTAWLGVMMPESSGRTLIVSAEEPADELRRRIYDVARAHGIESIPSKAIDVVDIHDVHVPFMGIDAMPTQHVDSLIEMIRMRGPYQLVIVDPLARISGASIDGDNVAACALITVLESVATAAGGLVVGLHHTSQTARRAGLVDATAIRGATGLGDSARMVLVLTAELVEHNDAAMNERLGEIVTLTRAKANHVGRWEPIRMRRGEHGVLVPLDSFDLEFIADARSNSDPGSRRRAQRDDEGRARTTSLAGAVRTTLAAHPQGLTYRGLRAAVAAAVGGCSDPALGAAIAMLGDEVHKVAGPRGATVHTLTTEADR